MSESAPPPVQLGWWHRQSRRTQLAIIAGIGVVWWGGIITAIAASSSGNDKTASEASPVSPTTNQRETVAQTTTAETTTVQETTEEAAPQEPEKPTGFGDGTHKVPSDIAPGTYRSSDETTCYWARLKGFSGELNDIIANGNNSPEIVTIGKNDAGFDTQACGDWVPVKETAPSTPAVKFGDGTYQVGVHIRPGTYSADGTGTCYWARLSNFSHAGVGGIITNGNNPTTIEIAASDAGFTTFGCGTWTP